MITTTLLQHTHESDIDALSRLIERLEQAVWRAHGLAIQDALEDCISPHGRMGLPRSEDWDGHQALVVLTLIDEIDSGIRQEYGGAAPQSCHDSRQLCFDFSDGQQELPF